MDREDRNGFECAEIYLLSNWSGLISARIYQSSEISDTIDLMFWGQKLTELMKIEPFILSTLYRPVVEIEPIYVEGSLHQQESYNNRDRPKAVSALPPKRQGRYTLIIGVLTLFVNLEQSRRPATRELPQPSRPRHRRV